MPDQLTPLVVGFLLTTVLGGILGYYFQNRTWKHQNEARVLETELQTALQVFENVSKLMDRRLYRMRLLLWRLRDGYSKQDVIEKYMELYREVLYDWNDNLNRNLALIQCYFGDDIRKQIDYEIYKQFRDIGVSLEEAYLKRKSRKSPKDLSSLEHDIEELSHVTYIFNIRVINLIQRRQVGIYQQEETSHKQGKQ